MNEAFCSRLLGGDGGHNYTLLGSSAALEAQLWRRKHSFLIIVLILLAGLVAVFVSG